MDLTSLQKASKAIAQACDTFSKALAAADTSFSDGGLVPDRQVGLSYMDIRKRCSLGKSKIFDGQSSYIFVGWDMDQNLVIQDLSNLEFVVNTKESNISSWEIIS